MRRMMMGYITSVDGMNRVIGRFAMYLIFVLFAILLWSTISKFLSYVVDDVRPANWTLETAQFVMVAYYILGGPYSIQLGSNVRMDLFYGGWSTRQKAWVDAFTIFFLLFFLAVLLQGAVNSLAYSLGYYKLDGQWAFLWSIVQGFLTGGFEGASDQIGRLEQSATAWRPKLWPIKLVMAFGIFIMILQAVSEFLKDVLRIRGEDI